METYRSAAEIAARRRRASVTPIPQTNIVAVTFGDPPVVKAEFGGGWYHAAAIQDDMARRPKA